MDAGTGAGQRNELAGVLRRGVQFLLDWLIFGVVAGASGALFLLAPTDDDGSISGGAVLGVTAIATVIVVAWAVWVWCLRPLRHGGQTYAMSMLGLRVQTSSGEPLTFSTMFTRALLLVIDAGITPLVGGISILASSKNQRIGDMVANTIVVRTS